MYWESWCFLPLLYDIALWYCSLLFFMTLLYAIHCFRTLHYGVAFCFSILPSLCHRFLFCLCFMPLLYDIALCFSLCHCSLLFLFAIALPSLSILYFLLATIFITREKERSCHSNISFPKPQQEQLLLLFKTLVQQNINFNDCTFKTNALYNKQPFNNY